MFAWKKTEDTTVDELISDLRVYLDGFPRESTEYAQILDQIIKLRALKSQPDSRRVSPDVMATICANLAGILMILKYEQAAIVTSKAISFVSKLR